jgi:hypothetical protein
MAKKIRFRRAVIVVLATVLLLALMCGVESLRYPRIARSAYWRHPHLLVRATAARLLARKGVSRAAVATHAKQLGRSDELNIRLLYLPDLPAKDKTIKARTLHLIEKGWGTSAETLFWMVTPHSNGRIINDDTLVYEYRTGRLVCAKEYPRLGEFAVE